VSVRYVARRLALAVPTAIGIVVVAFVVIHLAPGDPVLALSGEHGDAAYYAFIRAKFGLDRPLPIQLVTYLGAVFTGDLGVSFVHGRPVTQVLAERVAPTVLLTGTALLVSSLAGVAFGVFTAQRAHGPTDVAVRSVTLFGYGTPVFWLAQLAVLTLAVGAGWFPVQGMTNPRTPSTGLRHMLDVVHHLTLPVLILAAGELALTTRLVRSGLLDAMATDYVRTARAKGLSTSGVLRHAMRNTLLPVVTIIGGRLGMLLSGAVLVETVFAWPGLGGLLLSSVQSRDYPVLLGIFLLVSWAVIAANLITDLTYAWLDPRLRDA
jgi:peptide/nickel transport system permease protein